MKKVKTIFVRMKASKTRWLQITVITLVLAIIVASLALTLVLTLKPKENKSLSTHNSSALHVNNQRDDATLGLNAVNKYFGSKAKWRQYFDEQFFAAQGKTLTAQNSLNTFYNELVAFLTNNKFAGKNLTYQQLLNALSLFLPLSDERGNFKVKKAIVDGGRKFRFNFSAFQLKSKFRSKTDLPTLIRWFITFLAHFRKNQVLLDNIFRITPDDEREYQQKKDQYLTGVLAKFFQNKKIELKISKIPNCVADAAQQRKTFTLLTREGALKLEEATKKQSGSTRKIADQQVEVFTTISCLNLALKFDGNFDYWHFFQLIMKVVKFLYFKGGEYFADLFVGNPQKIITKGVLRQIIDFYLIEGARNRLDAKTAGLKKAGQKFLNAFFRKLKKLKKQPGINSQLLTDLRVWLYGIRIVNGKWEIKKRQPNEILSIVVNYFTKHNI